MAVYCGNCGQEATVTMADFGYGSYEYAGARGTHVLMAPASSCCLETLYKDEDLTTEAEESDLPEPAGLTECEPSDDYDPDLSDLETPDFPELDLEEDPTPEDIYEDMKYYLD